MAGYPEIFDSDIQLSDSYSGDCFSVFGLVGLWIRQVSIGELYKKSYLK